MNLAYKHHFSQQIVSNQVTQHKPLILHIWHKSKPIVSNLFQN